MSRKHDEERIMLVFDRCGREYSDATRALGTISELADLIDDIRHETAEEIRAAALGGVNLRINSYMTSERLRRTLAAQSESVEIQGGSK